MHIECENGDKYEPDHVIVTMSLGVLKVFPPVDAAYVYGIAYYMASQLLQLVRFLSIRASFERFIGTSHVFV